MKEIISKFLGASLKIKCITIATASIVTIGAPVTVYFASSQKPVIATTNVEAEDIVEEEPEEIIEEIVEEPEEEEEPENQEENNEEEEEQEEKKAERTVTYKEKTVVIPKSTVAPVNSSEDAEKDKKTGGEEVSQEKAETMFENVGQKSMGIDVSAHQGKINWAKVRESGVDFAIIRCGFRGQTEGKIYEDKYFTTNIKGAIANGVKVGIYFYSTAINETEALEEAAWVVKKIALYNITYPVVYDFEDFGRHRCVDVNGEKATKNALTFLDYVRSSGYEPMMYANKNDITNKMSRGSFSCKFWLAHYTEKTDYKGSFNMWQYTSKGSVPGISGNVDMDIAYFNYGTVAEPKHTHKYTTLVGKEIKATCTEKGSKTFRCSCGETKTEDIPMLAHSYGEWQVEIKATTQKEGLEKRICNVCKKEETRKIEKLKEEQIEPEKPDDGKQEENPSQNECEHEYETIKQEATCTEKGYELQKCKKCGKEENKKEIKPKGHTEGSWIIDKEATEEEEGSKRLICIICNQTIKTEIIEKLQSKTDNLTES